MILRPHHGPGDHRNGFLPDLENEEASHTSGLVMLQRHALKDANADHVSEKLDFGFRCQCQVDLSECIIRSV